MQSNNDMPAVVSFADFIKNQDVLPDLKNKQPSCKSNTKEKKLAKPKKLLQRKENNVKAREKITSISRNSNSIRDMLSKSNDKHMTKKKEQKNKTQRKRKCENSDDDIKITKIIPPKVDSDLIIDEVRSTDDVRITKVLPAPDVSICHQKSTHDCIPHLNRSTVSDGQWTDKYCPSSTSEVLINQSSINKLMEWLKSWREQIEKEREQLILLAEKERRGYEDDDDDFCLSREELMDADESLAATLVIEGSNRSCKTSTLYTCAHQSGFKVIELNASIDRSSKSMLAQLKEATQSHLVSKLSKQQTNKSLSSGKSSVTLKNFFTPNKNSLKKRLKKSSSVQVPATDASLVLIDEAEAVLESDKNFWSAISHLSSTSKRPIVLTTTSDTHQSCLEGRYEQIYFAPPNQDAIARRLKRIALKEHLQLSKSECNALYRACNDDVRQSILSLQFWGQNLVPDKERKTEPFLKLKSLHTILWGVPNTFLHAPHDASVEAAAKALAHLYHHNLHYHFLESSIFTTKTLANTYLTIQSTKEECMGNGCWAENDGDGELLSLVYNRCLTTSVPDTHTAKEAENKEQIVQGVSSSSSHDLKGVKRYLKCSEIYSLVDQLKGGFAQTFVNFSASNKFQDGVSDQHGDEYEPDYRTEMCFTESLAHLECDWLIKIKCMELNDAMKQQSATSPHELYPDLMSELRSEVATTTSLHLDVLPALRSICRMEERRRKSKSSRRFLHYLDAMGLDVTSSTSLILSQEYQFTA